MSHVDDSLQTARDAIKRRAWREAFDLLREADVSTELLPEDLESLAKVAWCTGRFQDYIDTYERAYAKYVERGNRSRAAYVALWLSIVYGSRRAASVAAGWRNRAVRMLDQEPECLEHGYLAILVHSDTALAQGDLGRALGHASSAFEIGKRFGDRDLQAFGLYWKGVVLVRKGEVTEGTVLLDEAMAAALGGELGPFTTSCIFCWTIMTCQNLADYRRAAEWIEAGERLCEREDLGVMSGDCRVHRAQIMRLRGAWVKAEQEARRACDEYRSWKQVSLSRCHRKGERKLVPLLTGLPGCLATGKTCEEVQRSMHEAIQMHVTGLREDNLPISGAKSFAEHFAVH